MYNEQDLGIIHCTLCTGWSLFTVQCIVPFQCTVCTRQCWKLLLSMRILSTVQGPFNKHFMMNHNLPHFVLSFLIWFLPQRKRTITLLYKRCKIVIHLSTFMIMYEIVFISIAHFQFSPDFLYCKKIKFLLLIEDS